MRQKITREDVADYIRDDLAPIFGIAASGKNVDRISKALVRTGEFEVKGVA